MNAMVRTIATLMLTAPILREVIHANAKLALLAMDLHARVSLSLIIEFWLDPSHFRLKGGITRSILQLCLDMNKDFICFQEYLAAKTALTIQFVSRSKAQTDVNA